MISVIVPCVNVVYDLGTCLQSLMDQTCIEELDIIVAGKAPEQISRLYPVRYVSVDGDLVKCVNVGLEHVEGNYVTFLLPTQKAEKNRIEKQVGKKVSIGCSRKRGGGSSEIDWWTLMISNAVFRTVGYLDGDGLAGYVKRIAAVYWGSEELGKECFLGDVLVVRLGEKLELGKCDSVLDEIVGLEKPGYVHHENGSIVEKLCSIVCCTNKPQCFRNIFLNFERQNYRWKELVLVINGGEELEEKMKGQLKHFKVRPTVVRLSSDVTLGECLNVGISLSKGEFISKFDDDDYYGIDYLKNNLMTMNKRKAKIVGRNRLYIHLNGRIREYGFSNAGRKTKWIAGPTLTFRRSLFNQIRFLPRNTGEDSGLLRTCANLGISIFATPLLRDFVYVRYCNNWDNPETEFLKKSIEIKVVLEKKLLGQIQKLVTY